MNTTLAQIILFVLVAALGVYVFALRSRLRDRVAMLILALIGVVLIAWPGLSTDLAAFVGIGRGTDLIFYLFIAFCLFRFVSQAATSRRLEQQLMRVVRDGALRSARPPLHGPFAEPASEEPAPRAVAQDEPS
jgi:hypothetical protein